MRTSQDRRYSNARERAEKQGSPQISACLRVPSGTPIFRPTPGIAVIDILPYVTGKGNPYADEGTLHWERTYWAHRGVGANQETILCPRLTFHQPCPICEYRSKLMKEGTDNEELLRSLAPKQRQLFNIIDRKAKDKGVQIWDISYHMFGKLLDARIRNSEEEDGWERFFHLEDGWTLKLGMEEKSFGSFSYLEVTTVDFKPRPASYSEEILEQVICLDACFVQLPYEEIKAMFLQSGAEGVPQENATAQEEEEDEIPYETKPKQLTPKDIPTTKKPAPKLPLEEEEEEEEEKKPAKPVYKKPAPKPPLEDEEEEEEEEEVQPAPKKKDIEEDWDLPPKQKSPAQVTKKPPVQDEDEDDWDLPPKRR